MSDACDICQQRGEINLVASGIAPITYGKCGDCMERGAENIGVISIWLASYGGPQNAPEYCEQLSSFLASEYVDWHDIREHYRQNEEEILSSFNAEFFGND